MIKSKKIRRLVSVVLVLVLATQFVFAASAATTTASYSFGEGVARVTKYNATVLQNAQPISGTKQYHTNGTTTYYSAGYYWIRYHSALTYSDYVNFLDEAAAELGFQSTYSLNAYTNAVIIPAANSSGNYCLKTDYYGYRGYYVVERLVGSMYEEVDSGSFSMAPYGCAGITGYVAYP